MDWYVLVAGIIILLVMLIGNIYFLAYNAHSNDTKFGSNIAMRILVVLAFSISYLPILMVPMDVANSQSDRSINMELLWMILLIVQMVCVWVLFPIFIVYYESNESDGLKKKLKRSMQVALPVFIVLVLATVPTYFLLSDYSIPLAAMTEEGIFPPAGSELIDGFYVGNVSFIGHLEGMMSVIGSVAFSFFGGVGFISLPYDLIYEYIFMPQPIQEKEFIRRKQILLNYTLKLREMGKSLENERSHVAQIKGFSGWRKRRAFFKKIRIFEARSLLAEKEFKILELEANYYQKVEPLQYTFKLILGIICALLTLNWLAQILFDILLLFKASSNSYLNYIMNFLIENNISIIGSFIFVIMAFYLLLVSLKGNMTYGYRTACFTFYPIIPNETQFNSFMFNALLLNFLTTSIIQFTCGQLPSLVSKAYVYQLLTVNTYTTFQSMITKYCFFSFLTLIVSIITLITLLVRGGRRLKFSELEKSVGKKGGSSSKDLEKSGKSQKGLINDTEEDEDDD